MPLKAAKPKNTVSFSDYKSLKNEIIEISEQRFENILTKRLKEFKTEFRNELMTELNPKFESIDHRFESMDHRFESIEKRLTFITWFIPIFITLLMFMFNYFKK